jgi:GDP/UDP-N,N'-diacetylbacillosamine 2-epimerase (hydrolysing)
MRKKYRLKGDFLLMAQHSVTEQQSIAYEQTLETIKAVERTGIETVAISPNSDAGSALVTAALDELRPKNMKIYKNVPREDYASLMKYSSCLIGNSSSALLEAPTFELPCVNIGRRQRGRVQGINVLNCEHNVEEIYQAIQKAIQPSFKLKLKGMLNPYGDGYSSERIVKILSSIAFDDKLLHKELTY